MQSIRTKFSVGLFVIIGMAVVILAILWLGLSDYFREGRKYAAYFDESVQGLSTDAAVKYRGVNVGRVDRIGVAPDGRLVEIVFTLNKQLQNPRNLIAQIKSVGITGIMFVELERPEPGEHIQLPAYEFETKYPIITTKPSEIKQLLSDVYDIIGRIKEIDMEGISQRLTTIMDNVNRVLSESKITAISEQLRTALERSNNLLDPDKWRRLRTSLSTAANNLNELILETKKTVSRMDKQVAGSAANFDAALDEVYRAADTADKVFARGAQTLEAARGEAAKYDRRLIRILDELEFASANLNRLLDQLNRQPSRIIFGEPLPEKPVAPEGR